MQISDYFSSSASHREWRRGRFHVMPVPGPGPSDVVTHPQVRDVGNTRLPDHVTITASTQPDGVYFLTRCTGCGARIEDSPAASRRLGQMEVEPFDAWLSQHAACATDPLVHRMPTSLGALVQRATQVAKHAVSLGEMVPAYLYVLSEDGRVWAVPYRREGVYGNGLDHDLDLETAWLHAWLRRWQRERGIQLEAALTIAEAWARPSPEDRGGAPTAPFEVVFGAAVTRRAGFFDSSTITRTGGIPGMGPGSFNDLQWMPLVDEASIVDLLLAG